MHPRPRPIPYWLYALSNGGSFVALLAYPFIVEQTIGLSTQRTVVVRRVHRPAPRSGRGRRQVRRPGAHRSRGRGCRRGPDDAHPRPTPAAGCCSRRGAGGTPLGGHELRHDRPHLGAAVVGRPAGRLPGVVRGRVLGVGRARIVPIAIALAPAVLTLMWVPLGSAAGWPIVPLLVIEYLGLGILAVALHGRLAMDRPAADHLTDFYLTMSTGGVIGGAFVAVIAPLAFDGVWEYPLLLVGRRRRAGDPSGRRLRVRHRPARPAAAPPAPWLADAAGPVRARRRGPRVVDGRRERLAGARGGLALAASSAGWSSLVGGRAGSSSWTTALVLVLATFVLPPAPVFRDRSFFGVTEVLRGPEATRPDARHDRSRGRMERPVDAPRSGHVLLRVRARRRRVPGAPGGRAVGRGHPRRRARARDRSPGTRRPATA